MMNEERLREIKTQAEAATPGPWVVGVWFSHARVNDGRDPMWPTRPTIPVGHCSWCAGAAPLLRTYVDRSGVTMHVHGPFPPLSQDVDWHTIRSASTGEEIAGNYDDEDGGICSTPEDAAFIAAARTDVPDLLAEVERLRAALTFYANADTHFKIGSLSGAPYGAYVDDVSDVDGTPRPGKRARQALGVDAERSDPVGRDWEADAVLLQEALRQVYWLADATEPISVQAGQIAKKALELVGEPEE